MEKPILMITGRRLDQIDTTYKSLDEKELTTKVDLVKSENGLGYHMDITLCNVTNCDYQGIIHIEVGIIENQPRFFMPGFMYGRNRGDSSIEGNREYPRIRGKECSCPASDYWMVRGDRLSNPVTCAYNNGRIIGISASPYLIKEENGFSQWTPQNVGKSNDDFYRYTGFTCHMGNNLFTTDRKYVTVGYTLGYENAPWLFIQSFMRKERATLTEENCITIGAHKQIQIQLFLYDYHADHITDIYKAIRNTYETFHQMPRELTNMSVQKAVEELAGAVKEAAWLPEDKCYSGFVRQKSDGTGYDYNKLGSLSWTNGMAVATPMLLSALRLSDDVMREQAVSCIDGIIKNCMNHKSGLPYDGVENGVWSLKSWWYDLLPNPGHSAYLVGQAVYYVLRAYEYEEKLHHTKHEDWLTFAKNIIDKVETTQNTDFEYPLIFSEETGAGIEYNSFGSCWILTASAYYAYLSKDSKDLKKMKKSEEHYYTQYVAKAECYGAPHDTNRAIDSEGILAYLRGLHYLHNLTGDDIYLNHMKDALEYEFTFKFCYNSPVKVPPLSKVGWSSCGGSITSCANPHIHPMSSSVVDEMLFYLSKRKDSYIQKRLQDTIMWGLQSFNTYDGEYDYGKIGWMSERFCYSQGLLVETYQDQSIASTWFTLMPWASASILDGFTGELWNRLS